MAERIRYVRIDIELPVKYRIINKPSSTKSAATLNFSAGGLCILSDEKLQQGEKVDIDLDLQDNSPIINLKGEIIWSARREDLKKMANGIKILEITNSSDESRFLQYYLNKLSEKFKSV